MNILVCVKQVPDTSELKVDPKTNTLIREGIPSIVNTSDTYALEAAARIRDTVPDTKIIAVTMGPMQAASALKDCLAAVADKAYIVSDRAFGGADSMATAYVLACAIKKIEQMEGKFDAVFCGKQTLDGDTAQVGPALAELLGLSQLTSGTDAVLENGALRVKWARDDDSAVARVRLPCLLTFGKGEFELRFGTIKRRKAANHADIPVFTIVDFPEIDRSRIGLEGSPTQVASTFCPPVSKECMRIDEGGAAASAAKLADILSQAHVI